MRAIVMGAGDRPGVWNAFSRLRSELEKHLQIVAVDFSWSEDMSKVPSEIALVFGGDGSVLRSAHMMGKAQRPVLAVNLGTLGFLANVRIEDLFSVLKTLDPERLPVVNHLMLECEIREELTNIVRQRRFFLNEVLAVHEHERFRMVHITLSVDGQDATTFRCDGLILSTPVGSTGHSLSAGGPILRKDIDAIVVVPINPHTLSQRPVIDSADRHYELRVVGSGGKVLIDGMDFLLIRPEDRVVIRRADVAFQMIELPEHGYYATLRDKLGWSGQIVRAEPPPE